MNKKIIFILIIAVFLLLIACSAPGPNPHKGEPSQNGHVAGYWNGLWHGVILPLTFIGSWFSDDINIYEVHNSGLTYHLGFITPEFIAVLSRFLVLFADEYL